MGAPDAEETRELLEDTLRDADGLIETFNALLGDRAGRGRRAARRLGAARPGRAGARRGRALRAAGRGERRSPCGSTRRDGAIILGHRQLVAQAIANLADNAIKYTPPGGHGDHRAPRAQPAPPVTVADTGPGIPPEQREHAKQRFVRLDAQRSTPGSGLGLSLVDAVAKLHDAQARARRPRARRAQGTAHLPTFAIPDARAPDPHAGQSRPVTLVRAWQRMGRPADASTGSSQDQGSTVASRQPAAHVS